MKTPEIQAVLRNTGASSAGGAKRSECVVPARMAQARSRRDPAEVRRGRVSTDEGSPEQEIKTQRRRQSTRTTSLSRDRGTSLSSVPELVPMSSGLAAPAPSPPMRSDSRTPSDMSDRLQFKPPPPSPPLTPTASGFMPGRASSSSSSLATAGDAGAPRHSNGGGEGDPAAAAASAGAGTRSNSSSTTTIGAGSEVRRGRLPRGRSFTHKRSQSGSALDALRSAIPGALRRRKHKHSTSTASAAGDCATKHGLSGSPSAASITTAGSTSSRESDRAPGRAGGATGARHHTRSISLVSQLPPGMTPATFVPPGSPTHVRSSSYQGAYHYNSSLRSFRGSNASRLSSLGGGGDDTTGGIMHMFPIQIAFLDGTQLIVASQPSQTPLQVLNALPEHRLRAGHSSDVSLDNLTLQSPAREVLELTAPFVEATYIQNCILHSQLPRLSLVVPGREQEVARPASRWMPETKSVDTLTTSSVPEDVVRRRSAEDDRKNLQVEIGSLIGRPLVWTSEEHEAQVFRKEMRRVRHELKGDMAPIYVPINADQVHTPWPENAIDKVFVRFKFPAHQAVRATQITRDTTAEQLLQHVWSGTRFRVMLPPNQSPDSCVIKVCGREVYISGDVKLFDNAWIRHCLRRPAQRQIFLTIISRQALARSRSEKELLVFRPRRDLSLGSGAAGSSAGSSEARSAARAASPGRTIRDDPSPSNLPAAEALLTAARLHATQVTHPLRLRVIGVENLLLDVDFELDLQIEAGVYHGGELLGNMSETPAVPLSENPRWYNWLVFQPILVCNVPRAARVCFTLYGKNGAKGGRSRFPLAWVSMALFDYKATLRRGVVQLHMWQDGEAANPIGTTAQNEPSLSVPSLYIEMPRYAEPVVMPPPPRISQMRRASAAAAAAAAAGTTAATSMPATVTTAGAAVAAATTTAGEIGVISPPAPSDAAPVAAEETNVAPTAEQRRRLDKLIAADTLGTLSSEDKQLIWRYRLYLRDKPLALCKVLSSVHWDDRSHVLQVYHVLLPAWAPLQPLQALELLDSRYGDKQVRTLAVSTLAQLDDLDLVELLPQLVNVLKYEPYHDSPLARFLLQRALRDRLRVGQQLFWHLKAELHIPEVSERYVLLLEQYLRGCHVHRREMIKQEFFIKRLGDIVRKVKQVAEPRDRNTVLAHELRALNDAMNKQGAVFRLPNDPDVKVVAVLADKCKVMSSKKKPLFLVLQNADPTGPAVRLMFKAGDDLRQDVLTLQMLKFMDKLWLEAGLDLRMTTYGCIATGFETGLIEIVEKAETTAKIQQEYGGATGAFDEKAFSAWLKQHNPDGDGFDKAVDNFVHSCAAHCVSTYVLGIGDRHNDNIMITHDGHVFDIDFGHFLGNFKRKFGLLRERAPFVFTPQYAHVLGGPRSPQFEQFVDLSCKAFNVLRRHSRTFVTFFSLMLSTGIPELQTPDDIQYLQDSFMSNLEDDAAAAAFAALIQKSLATKATQFDNYAHNLKHAHDPS